MCMHCYAVCSIQELAPEVTYMHPKSNVAHNVLRTAYTYVFAAEGCVARHWHKSIQSKARGCGPPQARDQWFALLFLLLCPYSIWALAYGAGAVAEN